MRKAVIFSSALVAAGIVGWFANGLSPAQSAATSAIAGKDLRTGWALLKEGEAEGTIEQDAKHPSSTSPHLLRIAVTKTAAPGKGRAGATNSTPIAVRDGEWLDVTFSGVTERGSIGLVFSLEGPDGKVLARTTLPEIGRGGRGRGRAGGATTTVGANWSKYLVSLHARAVETNAHLVITPIEATNVWLDGLTITPRKASE